MAVDPAVTEPMVASLRQMLDAAPRTDATAAAVAEMEGVLGRFDELAAGAVGIDDLMAAVTTEDLYQRFSTAYTEAATAGASAATGGEGGADDAQLLADHLAALQRVRDDASTPAPVRAALDRALELGASDIAYPVFLRRLEEDGLADAIQGEILVREGIVELGRAAAAHHQPVELERALAQLAAYDELAAAAAHGVPDPLDLEIALRAVDGEYAQSSLRWNAVRERVERMLDMVIDWLDAHAAFASSDERWRTHDPSRTRMLIERSRATLPGLFAERERQLRDGFGLTFEEGLRHDAVSTEIRARRLRHSDERIALAVRTVPGMTPGAAPDAGLVSATETLAESGRRWRAGLGEPVSLPLPAELG